MRRYRVTFLHEGREHVLVEDAGMPVDAASRARGVLKRQLCIPTGEPFDPELVEVLFQKTLPNAPRRES